MEQQIVNAVRAGDGDYELHTLRARLDANPLDLDARLEIAKRYQKLGYPEIAIEHGRLACERAPESEEAHLALAKMLRDAAKSAEGARMLAAYVTVNAAAGAGVWAWLGLLRDDTEDWKAGETAHRKALALAPGRDDLHNNLGYCLLRQGRREEAAAEFHAALKLHPHSVIAENNLALALTPDQTGNKEPVAHLQAVADPATAHNNMAVALIEAGRYAEAHQEIDAALRYNRAHSAALNNLRLLSDLDGHPAEMQAPVRAEGRVARLVFAWHRLWGSSVAAGRNTVDSGSTMASH
ncbi:MAG: tetratricopeptide repeat protein [Acidobacteriota bacterium]